MLIGALQQVAASSRLGAGTGEGASHSPWRGDEPHISKLEWWGDFQGLEVAPLAPVKMRESASHSRESFFWTECGEQSLGRSPRLQRFNIF